MGEDGSESDTYAGLAEAADRGAPPAVVAGLLLDILDAGQVPGHLAAELEQVVYRLASLRLSQQDTPQEDKLVRRIAGYEAGKWRQLLAGGSPGAPARTVPSRPAVTTRRDRARRA
jgi:hypothetical protein